MAARLGRRNSEGRAGPGENIGCEQGGKDSRGGGFRYRREMGLRGCAARKKAAEAGSGSGGKWGCEAALAVPT